MAQPDAINILLVDDQPAKLLTYETILAPLNENLLKAHSAKAALEYLLRQDIGVVLLDVCMPEMDGFELATMIRDHPRCRKTSIILVSAVYMSDFDRLRGYDSGAVDYVPVPIVPEVLRAKVSIFSDLYRKTQQLRALNAELEARVAERTSELEAALSDRAQLLESERQARAAAESANRLKDDFLATLSHELRTPINTVLGWVGLMRRRGPADPTVIRHGLEVIERGVRTQVQLIEDLLDVSRVAAGKLTIRREEVDLCAVLRAALETIRRPAAERQVTVTVMGLEGNIRVAGDATRLEQVFWNLLSNSAKFTPAGGRIDVEIHRSEEQVAVTVKDNGQGISPEFLPKVFDRFRQGDSSMARIHTGLGLGLSIAHHLVTLHKGTITAFSDGEGRGARFTVELPLLVGRPGAPASEHADLEPQGELFGLMALIVDDDADTREILARILSDHGMRTITADGADAAIELLRTQRPDVLVCDIGMPGKDGLTLIREIRCLAGCEALPAVALTAYTRDVDRRAALEAGFQRHLCKPLDPWELVTALVELTHSAAPTPAPVDVPASLKS